MPAAVTMPALSDSMQEGTIIAWLRRVGDEVALGDELVEIETDKANMTYAAEVAGTLLEIVAADGSTHAVGATIALIGAPGESIPAEVVPVESMAEATSDGKRPQQPGAAVAQSAPARAKASPLARRLAAERGVDLLALVGTGPGGRIVRADVESASAGQAQVTAVGPGQAQTTGSAVERRSATARGDVEVVKLTRLQETVARRMSQSKATAPHFYLHADVDMTAAVKARETLADVIGEGEPPPSFNDMVVKACALALREFPRANGSYRDGRFELFSRVNVGIAVAAEDALVVPTIFDADVKGLAQIAAEARLLAARVRSGEITPPELAGATFTVSNLGMYGVSHFEAVIDSPQAAILAVGQIAKHPAIRDGQVVAADRMQLTLSCDHRILYGAEGARFLARVRALLESPVGLAL